MKKNTRKLYLFNEVDDEYRFVRFKEEAKKKNVEVVGVNIYKSVVKDDYIFFNGKKVCPTKKDVCWAISNSSVNHYIIKILQNEGITIWPDKNALDFSDKFYADYFFSRNNIPTPPTMLINSLEMKERVKGIKGVGGFPCIIKKTTGSMGKYVEIVNSEKEIHSFIKNSFDTVRGKKYPLAKMTFILQKYLKEANGSDYRVLCLENEVIGIIKRTSVSGFKANISLGGQAEMIVKNKTLEKYAKKIMKTSGLFFAGIDFIETKGGYVAIEINTSAQFRGFEAATGINVAEKIITALLAKSKKSAK